MREVALFHAADAARRAGRPDVLDAPLLALAWRARVHSPRGARHLARAAAHAPRAMSIGELVRVGAKRGALMPTTEDASVRAAIAGVLAAPPQSPARVASSRAPDLQRFAETHDLVSLLDRAPISRARAAFGAVPDEQLPPRTVSTLRAALAIDSFRPMLARLLEVEAEIASAEQEARARPYPLLAHGVHGQARATWLRDAAARLARDQQPWLMHEDRYARASLVRVGFEYEEIGEGTRARIRVEPRLPFSELDLEDEATRRALWWLMDIVNEPVPDERDWMEQHFAPRHAAVLHALAQLAPPRAAARGERLVWILKSLPPHPTVEPMLQRATKGDAFTKGTRVHTREILTGGVPCATEQDRAAAALLDRSLRHHADALRALKGHPFLMDGARAPWTIEVARAEVEISEDDEGYRVRVHAAGRDVPAPRAGFVDAPTMLGDSERRVLTFVEVSPQQLALARAIAESPLIPRAAAPELVAVVEQLQSPPQLSLARSPSLQGEEVAPDERVIVRLDPEGSTLCARIGFRPIASGGLVPPALGAEEIAGLDGERRVRARRVFAHELARARAVRERLPIDELDVEHEWVLRATAPDAALALVERLQALASEGVCVVEWKDGRAALMVRGTVQPQSLRLRVRSVHDWLGVDGEADVDGELVTLGALLEAVRNGRRYVQVSSERFVALSSELRARVQPIAAFAQDSDGNTPANARTATTVGGIVGGIVGGVVGGIELAPSLAGALSDLQDDGARFDASDAWTDVARRAAAARLATDEPPPGLLADLRSYQRAGVRFLRRLAAWETGGVLADDMGLGKTVQAIAALVERAPRGPQLVLAPTSVCFNWQRELARFAPSLRVHALSAAPTVDARRALLTGLGPRDVVIAGYAVAVSSAEAFSGVRFESMVLDEAQAVKNADTLRARFARDVQAPFKIALTGTPLENHLGELWSIFRIVSPALFGSHDRFRTRYAIPIERDRSLQKRKELAQALRPFLLRRTKDEVLTELPARTEIVQTVELGESERTRYDATRAAVLADALADDVDAPRDRRFRVLAGLTRLRLLACHPRLVDQAAPAESAKLTAIVRTVRDLQENKHRALVFSQFVKHLALVRPALADAGISTLQLDGSTPAAERARLVDQFQAGAADVFLLSLKAGGAGLNLTAADYVLHLDPWWNPAVEDQATGRAHRIGQEKPVTVYRFVARGTIEEQMVAMHAEKRDLVDGVLEGADAAGALSVEELVALLR